MVRRLAGLSAHIRPVFMLPVLAVSVCGALLAPSVNGWLLAQHAAGAGAALFVAHLRDGFVDGHLRGEEDPPLPVSTYRWATAGATLATLLLVASLAATTTTLAAGSLIALLCLALLHAPYLDRYTVPVTVDYPVGIALTLAGGFVTQTGRLRADIAAVAVSVALLLAAIKVGIDQLDATFDGTIGKRTVPVVVGTTRARWVAFGGFVATALAVLAFVWVGVFPWLGIVAAAAAIGCAGAALTLSPYVAVRAQIALSYVYVGALFVALCGPDCVAGPFVPLSSIREVHLYLVGGGPQLVKDFPFTPLL
ncbi:MULTISPECIES: hypothetical protein [Halorubrum]|uniref:hypothetical protein n=1 Tax=Halorubrum TaxID=56688 RepID=UPI0006B1C5D7|nr:MULTISPECIES: hypothetical protein [Halorubrum]MDB2238994.1 hypothetical protein [Halorubrum ezzemoulense]MDB2249731.1 hypothetical protein [Halorubrum ezzemoulense]